MILYPNAKLNIGLSVVGKRADGYHLLESLMIPIPLYDVLEVKERPLLEEDQILVFGTQDSGVLEDNIVLKAIRLFREQLCPQMPRQEVVLFKHIPSGAGMGGGSSDASFMLRHLRQQYASEISLKDLALLALSLGADCPFFIYNEPMLARGVGEELEPYPLGNKLSGYRLLLIKPSLAISTREAFSGIEIGSACDLSLEDRLCRPLAEWQQLLPNAFEKSLFPLYPILEEIKAWCLSQGAIFSSMTGSGSTIFALSEHSMLQRARQRFPSFFIDEFDCNTNIN